jgi:hypothetical protein
MKLKINLKKTVFMMIFVLGIIQIVQASIIWSDTSSTIFTEDDGLLYCNNNREWINATTGEAFPTTGSESSIYNCLNSNVAVGNVNTCCPDSTLCQTPASVLPLPGSTDELRTCYATSINYCWNITNQAECDSVGNQGGIAKRSVRLFKDNEDYCTNNPIDSWTDSSTGKTCWSFSQGCECYWDNSDSQCKFKWNQVSNCDGDITLTDDGYCQQETVSETDNCDTTGFIHYIWSGTIIGTIDAAECPASSEGDRACTNATKLKFFTLINIIAVIAIIIICYYFYIRYNKKKSKK